jgi:hypothetical protein
MATGSVLASTAGYAFASADAQGTATGSPGVGSGNLVQVPVNVPVNVCGNTINIVGLLNPAIGNTCANVSSGGHGRDGHGATRGGGADAEAAANGSPGVLSGNAVQVPIHVPVNVCGNSVDAVALLNPAIGNTCVNADSGSHAVTTPPVVHHPSKPPVHHRPPRHNPPVRTAPAHHTAPGGGSSTVGHHAQEVLASTGAGDAAMAATVAAGMILGGAVLYRRGRVGAR